MPASIPYEVLLLGGGQESPEGVGALEIKSKDAAPLPDWYRRNAGRARDLAFVLFTGAGETTRAVHITNARWALTAYGVATSAELSGRDTVFTVSPMHHPAGLLTAIGGAVVGGARIGMVTSSTPPPSGRRYAATASPSCRTRSPTSTS